MTDLQLHIQMCKSEENNLEKSHYDLYLRPTYFVFFLVGKLMMKNRVKDLPNCFHTTEHNVKSANFTAGYSSSVVKETS